MRESTDLYSEDGFMIRRAVGDDTESIYECMLSVYNALEDKSVFVCEDIEYVKHNIEEHGFSVVAETEDGIIAGVFIFEYPDMDMSNLGRDIGLLESELGKVVHMDTVVVRPEYRGRRLQIRMLEFAEGIIDVRYRYYMATAAPYNKPSITSFLKSGYRVVKVTEKYGGFIRAILLKDTGNRAK